MPSNRGGEYDVDSSSRNPGGGQGPGPRSPSPRAPKPGGDDYSVHQPASTGPKHTLPPHMRLRPIVEPAPLPTAPRIPFWSGLFTFPFYPQSLLAWMTLAFAATFGWLTLLCTAYYLSNIGPFFSFGMVFGVAVVVVLSGSYMSACYLWIVQQTADGYDRIEDWELGEWREWPVTLVATGPMFCLSLSVGGAVAWLAGASGEAAILFSSVTLWVLYPVLLLSVLESGSSIPWSPATLRSLHDVNRGWFAFYLESGLLMAAWLIPVVALFMLQPFLVVFVAGPPLGAAIMIHARLLGRLAWYIEQCNQRALAAREEEERT